MIQKDEILKILADKHNLAVRKEDPIFVILAVNEVILHDFAQTLASTVQKLNEETISCIRTMLERQQNCIKQEQESVCRYCGQILRDYQIKFERSIDGTINTIKEWYMEIDQMKSSTALMAGATLIFMIMGSCAAGIINWWH